eukprot:COSAG02_NODE_11792_length_1653_cov_1.998713_1_plen_77_part_00
MAARTRAALGHDDVIRRQSSQALSSFGSSKSIFKCYRNSTRVAQYLKVLWIHLAPAARRGYELVVVDVLVTLRDFD